jgi:hypothetical protein
MQSNRYCLSRTAKIIRLISIFTCVIFSTSAFSKATILNTKISHLSNVNGLWIELTVTNESNDAICIDNRMIGLDGEATVSAFTIYKDGKSIGYRGLHVSRADGYVPNHIELLPQQSVKVNLNLATDYDFSKKGIYKVQHQTFSGSDCGKKSQIFELISNPIMVTI